MTRSAGEVGSLTKTPRSSGARGGGAWCAFHPATPGTTRPDAPLIFGSGVPSTGTPDRRERLMVLFARSRGGASSGRRGPLARGSGGGDLAHLERFVQPGRGVEGYVEPRTAVTETTIVLVATDGEWTRRRIDGPETARRLSRELGIPVYDAQVTGYPQRMRDWNKDPRPPSPRTLGEGRSEER